MMTLAILFKTFINNFIHSFINPLNQRKITIPNQTSMDILCYIPYKLLDNNLRITSHDFFMFIRYNEY